MAAIAGKKTTEERLRVEVRRLRKTVKELREELVSARAETLAAERHARRLRAKRALEVAKERAKLEAQLTQLVQEIGQVRHLAERYRQLEAAQPEGEHDETSASSDGPVPPD